MKQLPKRWRSLKRWRCQVPRLSLGRWCTSAFTTAHWLCCSVEYGEPENDPEKGTPFEPNLHFLGVPKCEGIWVGSILPPPLQLPLFSHEFSWINWAVFFRSLPWGHGGCEATIHWQNAHRVWSTKLAGTGVRGGGCLVGTNLEDADPIPKRTLWKWAFNWAVLKGHDWNVFVFIVLVGKNSC